MYKYAFSKVTPSKGAGFYPRYIDYIGL